MATENFTLYTEVDPNSRITKTSSRVTWTGLTRNEDAYVYDDKGVGYFDGGFTMFLDVRATAVADGSLPYYWSLANLVDDAAGIQIASGDLLGIRQQQPPTPDEIQLHLREIDGGAAYTSGTYAITLDTTYYLKIVRNEGVGTYGTLYLYIYSDSSRTSLLDTLSITLHSSKKDFRYIYAAQSHNTGHVHAASGYTENLSLAPLPTVTTQECTDTVARSSTGHGLYSTGGDSSVTQHGHVWSTSANPTISDSKTENGASPNLGQFSSNITGLTPTTLYYVAAYATNTEGTNYGSDVTITTGTTIGKRFIWTEGTEFHYFDAYGVERVLQGHETASDKDILPWLDPFS